MTTNIFLYMKVYFYYTRQCIIKYLLPLYKKTYNDNKYFFYIREYIMTTNIFVIHESVFLIIQDDV